MPNVPLSALMTVRKIAWAAIFESAARLSNVATGGGLGKLLDMLTDPAEDLGKPKLVSTH